MTVSTGTEAPVEQTGVALGRSLRVALVHGREEASRRAVAHLALASGAEIVARVRATDPRSCVEAAQALRDAKADVVAIQGGAKDEGALAELLEALRLGCGAQRPMPRIFGLVDTRVAHGLRMHASPFEFERFGAPSEMVEALRDLRRGGNGEVVLRDAVIEDAARALATTTGANALAVDVTERSTSFVLASPDGRTEAAHLVPLGLGMGADHVVARASLDNVRRWLPWPIDAPALLERVFNRGRRPQGPATAEATVLLEMALAREAIAHALRDTAEAGLDVSAMRSAPSILITGRAASFPKSGQSLLVLVDGLEPSAVSTVFREPDEGPAERIAMVVSVIQRRPAKIRIVRASGRSVARVVPGSFGLVAMGPGDVVAGTVLARVGRRFARSVTAPIDGRLLHVTVDGDLYIAPIVDRWTVRATLDGTVARSDDAVVEIEGEAWCFQAAAAYGPDAIGELTLGVDGPDADLAPTRIDVRLAGRIIVGGARVSAEVITRPHACGVAGLVAGGVPPAGLRVVYGDTVTASGSPSRDDRPTVLCLMGFGSAVLPRAVYEPFAALAGARAAIHTASARLFVFSTADIGQSETLSPEGLTEDRPATDVAVERADAESDETDSEHEEPAQTEEELTPSASD